MSAPGATAGSAEYLRDVLAGAHAVVTGGGSGIGLAIARRLDAMGATLTLIGRDEARLARALGEFDEGRHDAIGCDVRCADDVARAFGSIAARTMPFRILVNNAGVATSGKFLDVSEQVFDDTLRGNVGGVFHCTRAALPLLLDAPFGRIVNVASTAGLVGYPYVTAYCAAKHAVVGLTRSLALELARSRVTVNAVCPGYADTDMTARTVANIVAVTGRSPEDARRALVQGNPQGRLVTPEEVAGTVAWLCLPSSQSITGQAISVSGGEVMP